MTSTNPHPTDEALAARFRPVFARIAEHAVDRERHRRLAHAELGWLRESGFGTLRVPVEHGGLGVSLTQLFALLTDLAAAESNLTQALRTHFAFVEDRLAERDTDRGKRWLEILGGGAIFGNATSERANNVRGDTTTRLTRRGDEHVLNGSKFYSTGTLYADYLTVLALDDAGARVQAITRADAPGVRLVDDYRGFGQRTSASGSTFLTDVRIPPADVIPAPDTEYRGHRFAFLQLVQLAGLAGIARRAATDTAELVRARRRGFVQGNADLPRHDPLVQQVLGRVDSAAHAARALVLDAANSLERAVTALGAPGNHAAADPAPDSPQARAEMDAYRAQITVIDLVLRATSELFEVGGASLVNDEHRLDRHWRNARTLAVHNPAIYKHRILGDYLLNGTVPRLSLTASGLAHDIAADQR